jgi:hypothetical protein
MLKDFRFGKNSVAIFTADYQIYTKGTKPPKNALILKMATAVLYETVSKVCNSPKLYIENRVLLQPEPKITHIVRYIATLSSTLPTYRPIWRSAKNGLLKYKMRSI